MQKCLKSLHILIIPPEDGRYVRGNDASPVAVAIILNHDADKIPPEIETLVRTGFEGDPELIRKAVWSCYQEKAVEFRGYSLFDPGAIPEQPLSGRITMNVTNPWIEQPDEKERDAIERSWGIGKPSYGQYTSFAEDFSTGYHKHRTMRQNNLPPSLLNTF